MATWLEDTIQALKNLGGVASLINIYYEVEDIRPKPLPKSSDAIVRGILETYSSDSKNFKGNDIFCSVKGIGKGMWGLRSVLVPTPPASDISDAESSSRIKTEVYRILRDTALGRNLKLLHGNRCQICGNTLKLQNEEAYSEAHHIKPLGSPHNGPDIASNIIILCPNCHVKCDYGSISINLNKLYTLDNHLIGNEFISYHNTKIYNS